MAISPVLLDYANLENQLKNNDHVLWPFLDVVDRETCDRLLDQLIREECSPIIKRIFEILHRRHRSQGFPPVDYEDVAQDVAVGLIKRLRILKQNPEFKPINDFAKYVNRATQNAYYRKILEGHPKWLILKNQATYFFSNDPLYASWIDADRTILCGFSTWRGSSSELTTLDVDSLIGFVKRDLDDDPYPVTSPQGIPLQELALRIFHISKKPLRLLEFIRIVGEIWGLGSKTLSPIEVEEIADERQASGNQSLTIRMEYRQTLRFLVEEISQLPVHQRKAILYSLRVSGRSALLLMHREEIIRVDQLSKMLGKSEQELEIMLVNELPLSDAEIGKLLGVSAEKARNFRKCGIERLARRLEAYEKKHL